MKKQVITVPWGVGFPLNTEVPLATIPAGAIIRRQTVVDADGNLVERIEIECEEPCK